MAQVPVIQRAEPQATPSQGRTQLQTFDTTQATAKVGGALLGLAEKVGDTYLKVQDTAAKTKAEEIGNIYEQERADRLYGANGLVHMKGDVSEAYQKYDEDGKARINELLESGNLSDLAKQKTLERLNEIDNRYAIKSTMAYGKQNNDYIQDTAKTRVGLLQNDLVDSSSLLKQGDPTSYGLTDAAIMNIMKTRYDEADKLNIPRETAHLAIANDLSTGVEKMVTTLTNSGNPNLAEEAFTKYSKYLDAQSRPRVQKTIQDEKVKFQANNLAAEAERSKNPMAVIDKEPNLEIRNKAKQVYNDSRRYKEYERERIAEDTYNRESLRLEPLVRGGKYVTKTQLDNDKQLQSSLRLMTPEQRKNIYGLIKDKDKKTDIIDMVEFQNQFLQGNLVGMDASKFAAMTNGFNDVDYRWARSLWTEQNKDPESARRGRLNWAQDRLYQRMVGAKLLTFVDGKLSSTSKNLWDQASSNMIQNFSTTIPKNADEAAYEKSLDTFIVDQVKIYNKNRSIWSGKLEYTPPSGAAIVQPIPRRGGAPAQRNNNAAQEQTEIVKPQGSQQTAPVPPTKTGKENQKPRDYTAAELADGIKQYKKLNPTAKPNPAAVKKFMQERGM